MQYIHKPPTKVKRGTSQLCVAIDNILPVFTYDTIANTAKNTIKAPRIILVSLCEYIASIFLAIEEPSLTIAKVTRPPKMNANIYAAIILISKNVYVSKASESKCTLYNSACVIFKPHFLANNVIPIKSASISTYIRMLDKE